MTLKSSPQKGAAYGGIIRFAKILLRTTIQLPFMIFQFILEEISWVRLFFFETSKQEFLIAAGNENFVVSTRDKIIAKKLFTYKQFDLEKFHAAEKVAGINTKNMILVDVGANIGSICIPLVKRKSVSGAIAIEPEPHNYKLLRTNVVLNDVENRIVTINKALGAIEEEVVMLELSNNNYGDHRIYSETKSGKYNEANRKRISVPSTTLDAVLSDYKDTEFFLWMDTQGYEGHILRGANETLKKCPPLVLEFWPYGMKRARSFEIFKESLLEGGYSDFYDLEANTPKPLELNINNLDALYEQLGDNGRSTDILLVK